MKVKLEKDYRQRYTLEELDQAKTVINYEKEYDCDTAAGWIEMAVREALKNTDDWMIEVIKADATTAKNCRAWKAYGEESGQMDVWIDAIAETVNGFIRIGAYLSDIWQTGAVDYRQHMYVVRYGRI